MAKKAAKSSKKPAEAAPPASAALPAGLAVETVPIDSLQFDPTNAKKHGARDLKVIGASIEKFGQVLPLVVWKGIVKGGNGTLQAMRSLGLPTVSIVRVDHLTEAKARELALVLNRSSQLSEWNEEVLLAQLRELESVDVDLDAMGFDRASMDALVDSALAAAGETSPTPRAESGGSDPAEARAGKTSASPSAPPKDRFQILITCRDESHQTELLDRFDGEQLECRALTT